ncbi:hypothetical protein DFH08DRAFT_941138 [Mycena albidolilacea]|uniref:F-box domain-containing protein n=1 Tax=Mycena albidolilacea TaxID=1033008 RepID=A0AAD6ZJT2_9AGAR|nr:hypothetical protein DFH08DRAFT_941138 [Mycena albidolilacea]
MDGSRVSYLNTVTTEIWARFWFYSSSTDLRRLMPVCRYFRDICQPFLFQRQHFRAPDSADFDPEFWLDSVRDLHRSTIRLRKLGGSIHASSVRSWNFDGHGGYASLVDTHPNILNITSMEETYLKLVRIFADTLAVYQNLRSLHLSNLTLDSGLRQTLAGLIRLDRLYLFSCSITSRTGPLLALREFQLGWSWGGHDEDADHLVDLVSPERLRVLSLSEERQCGAVLAAFSANHSIFQSLVTLSIELNDSLVAVFLRFLRQCPQLTQLGLTQSSFFSRSPRRLPGPLPVDIIPRLCSFKGPCALAAFFVSDRPLAILKLEDGSNFGHGAEPLPEDVVCDVVEIALSTPGVHTFTIDVSMHAMLQLCAAVATHWPNLCDLRLVLIETPPPPPAQSDEEVSFEVMDGRDIDFSDNDSLDSVATRGSYHLTLDFGPIESVPLPDVLVPGYMYSAYYSIDYFKTHLKRVQLSTAMPLRLQRLQIPVLTIRIRFLNFVDCICLGRLSLPSSLEALRIRRSDWARYREDLLLSDKHHHRIVLALEAQLPTLREVDFGRHGVWWRCRST